MSASVAPELSIVVPLFNEEESLPLLVAKLLEALRPLGRSFERCSSTTAPATPPPPCCGS